MNFHIIIFGLFLDVIEFVDKSSYANRTYQHIGVIGKFWHSILCMPRVEIQIRHHIRRRAYPRALDDGYVAPGYKEGDVSGFSYGYDLAGRAQGISAIGRGVLPYRMPL